MKEQVNMYTESKIVIKQLVFHKLLPKHNIKHKLWSFKAFITLQKFTPAKIHQGSLLSLLLFHRSRGGGELIAIKTRVPVVTSGHSASCDGSLSVSGSPWPPSNRSLCLISVPLCFYKGCIIQLHTFSNDMFVFWLNIVSGSKVGCFSFNLQIQKAFLLLFFRVQLLVGWN